ncbi:MAG: hypothetical protein ACI4D4_06440 [Lachnospira sp.]
MIITSGTIPDNGMNNTVNFALNNKEVKNNEKSIDARNLNLNFQMDGVEAKRKNAKKQAMKLISDAWERDEKTARGIKTMQEEKNQKVSEIQELKSRIKDIDENKEQLRQEYGVSEDSEEYKDLKLLEKYQNNKTGASFDDFSDEEIERLKELQNTPLTEYQKKSLELNGVQNAIGVEIQKGENSLIAMNAAISDAKLEQVKSQVMLKSQDAAGQILDAANKDIIGMLVDEAKEHIDNTFEEEEEKAEEIKEKREEQTVDHVAEVQKNLYKMMKDNYLINEDLMGIEIDLNF